MVSHLRFLFKENVFILVYTRGHYHLSETKICSSIFLFINESLLLQVFIEGQ